MTSSNSNFLFSPANPSTSKDNNHSNGSSQSSTAKSNQQQHHHQVEPNTSTTTCSSSPSSSRDSNGNPFSFSCSSSSSQSLHSSISWQTDNTSFANSNSPPEDSSASHHRPISHRDRESAAAASNNIHSRPNSSSSGNHSINGNGAIDSNHHRGASTATSSASGPNLTFTHTFPRFNLSDHQLQHHQPSTVDVFRRNSHNPIHSIHHGNHNHNHRLSYDSAATAINHQEQSNHSLLGYHHPASSSSYQHPSFQYNHESLHHHPSSFDPYSNHQSYPNYHQSSYKAHPAPVPTATPTPPILPTPRPKVTTTLWEDEGTLCYQVDSKGVCVARRHDNNMINGTKLLNVVTSMTRGKRDTILKMEKSRVVVKSGSMHLKGVWIAFEKAKQLAEQNKIIDGLYPLFEEDISTFLYTPENYLRTSAVMAAAKKRNEVRDQEKAEMEKKASVRTAKTDLAKARKESLDGQISEITAPRSALAALEASRSQGQGQDYQHQPHYGGGTNLRPPVDLSQFRSHSYSGGGTSLNHSPREMGPPSISNASPVPTSQFSFHVPYSTERPRSANSSEHHSNSNSHSPSSEIPSTTNLQLSGLASRPIRQSSFDRRHSMPLRAGENEDNEVFSHSLPRFADAAFANAIRGGSSNTPSGITPSLSPLNIMSPNHPASPFGMVMNPNLYSSPTLSQHSQSQQQQLQYGNLSPEQQYKFQQQSKHQSYFPPHHQHTSSNSSSFPTNHHHHHHSSSPSSSRAASISSPGDYRNPSSHSSRSVSREHYLGNGQNQNHSLPGFSNNAGWNSEYSHPTTSSPIPSQFPTSSSGRSHSISHSSSNSNQNHRGSIPPIHTQNNNIGSNSMDPSPTSSSGLKRSRASLTNDDSLGGGQQRFSLNMSTSNSTDSNGGSQGLSSSSSNNDLLDLSQHSNFDTNRLDGNDGGGQQQRRDSNDDDDDDDDEIDREMKRSRSDGTGGNPLDDLANATAYLEG